MLAVLAVPCASAAVSPSQVLVLYNADWSDDAPLTDPGQDSKEIAEHYVALHTDPATGERPHLLGLRCVHGREHLNGVHLSEESTDNDAGVVLRRGGVVLGSAGEARDSRALEFALPEGGWRFESLRLELRPGRGEIVRVIDAGRALVPGAQVQEVGPWQVRLDGRRIVAGPLVARATCTDAAGRERRWEAEYEDVYDVACSRTGPDGFRDDQNYLDDVERPVKAFLDDPRNARPDGTPLKDHVLFVVVCYGLPKTAAATYGIARGITDRLADHGADIDLGQRLQLLYYDVEGALGFTPRAHRFEGGEGFARYVFRAPQAWPLWGQGANPFAHPLAYRRDKGDLDRLAEPLAFTRENRARHPGRHLYGSMRLDGTASLEARGLVDRAVYASKYGGPGPGGAGGTQGDPPGDLRRSKAGSLLWDLGYRRLRYRSSSSERLQFLRLPAGAGYLNRSDVFLPGGIAATIISHNGWNRPEAEMLERLAEGVTVTAGAARVYSGAPHIHDKSWWDDELLYPLLLGGKTVGEALLANQLQLEWIATFVGDPLLRLPSAPKQDGDVPAFDAVRDVRVEVHRAATGERGVWLRVDLRGGLGRPEVAQLKATGPDGREALCETFEGRPYALLGAPAQACGRPWRVETLDPAGNRLSADVLVTCREAP